jgi:hypothetical protein
MITHDFTKPVNVIDVLAHGASVIHVQEYVFHAIELYAGLELT